MGTLESIYRSTINTVPPQPEAQLPMRPNKMSFSRMDPQHVCVLCDQTFSKKSNLVRHMNNTHHQVSVKQECPDCGKTFNRKDNLKQHQSICLAIRFKCPRCHRILQDIASLTRHMGLCPVPKCTLSGTVCGSESAARTQENPHQKTQSHFHPRLQDEEETQTKPWRFSLSCVFRLVHHKRRTLSPQTKTHGGPKTLPTCGTPLWWWRRKVEQFVAWKCWIYLYLTSLHSGECWFQFPSQPITKPS